MSLMRKSYTVLSLLLYLHVQHLLSKRCLAYSVCYLVSKKALVHRVCLQAVRKVRRNRVVGRTRTEGSLSR
ncbi:hypothetical protein F5X97DRAFT_309260 [Nemania serpens]|nr:hypothetical protein F5X97DRAFT_309260 [Nemania serpens]